MGPIALFDKSFLQSLSLDESVWFGHFFLPVICPLFYVETLADLQKAARAGRTPQQEVGIIAQKFPDLSGSPCVHHATLLLGELLGHAVPLDGRIPRPGGRAVSQLGKRGIVYDEFPEAEAFSRWQCGKFLEIERDLSAAWRATLNSIDLQSIAKQLRELGIDATRCRSLDDALSLARAVINVRDKPYAVIAMVLLTFSIPDEYHRSIIERWKTMSFRALPEYAPYTAHLLTVELFFQFSLASHLIGTERASNRIDIAYLNYIPFCDVFVSTDDLHRRCAPLFIRPNQDFVWGPTLKGDLRRINDHFLAFPEVDRERGIMDFAHSPPKLENSLVRQLRAKRLGANYDDQLPVALPAEGDPKSAKLVEELKTWTRAPVSADDDSINQEYEPDVMAIERRVRKKKGSWWQVPKDLKPDSSDG